MAVCRGSYANSSGGFIPRLERPCKSTATLTDRHRGPGLKLYSNLKAPVNVEAVQEGFYLYAHVVRPPPTPTAERLVQAAVEARRQRIMEKEAMKTIEASHHSNEGGEGRTVEADVANHKGEICPSGQRKPVPESLLHEGKKAKG